MRISYLGPVNSYSHIAACRIKTDNDILVEYPTFSDVTDAVGVSADIAIVPIENSIEGAVSNILDILAWEKDLYITRELNINIDHKLIMLKSGNPNNIKKVLSHWQAYGQCRKIINKLYPNAEIVFTSSTSKAVDSLEQDDWAAIASGQNLNEKYKIVNSDIQENSQNITKFVTLSKEPINSPNASKVSIVFEAENRPGGLLKLLTILEKYKLDMTKIESRPYKQQFGRYIFFVDFLGNINDDNVKKALAEIQNATNYYKYLGNY